MKSHFYSLLVLIVLLNLPLSIVFAQGSIGVNTNTPHESASLEVFGTNKGFLLPRVALSSTAANSPVNNPASGLMVYNTATVNDVLPGYYYWDGSKWIRFGSSEGYNFDNGLTEANGLVTLGGTLNQQTEIAQAGNNFVFTGSGNVGIGLNNPGAKLHVSGTVRATSTFQSNDGSAATPAFRFTSQNGVGMYRAASNVLGFSTAGIERARIDASGNITLTSLAGGNERYVKTDNAGLLFASPTIPFSDITGVPTYDESKWTQSGSLLYPKNTTWNVGIGTTTVTSGAKLDVLGLAFSNGYRTRSNNTDYHQFNRTGGGAAVYINQTDATNPILRLSSGTATANVNVVATFENNGNFGLGTGTTIPTARLHVNGSVRFQTITNGYIKADASGNLSSAATIPFTDITGAPIYDDSKWTQSGSLLYPKNTAWNVGVGTVSPTSKLDVVGGSIRVPATVYEGAGQIQSSGTVRIANGSSAQSLYVKQLSASDAWADNDTYTQTNGIYSKGNLRAGGATVALFANTTTGNVGIGTIDPSTKLDVNGIVRIRGGSPEPGKVLMASSANGTATWQDPAKAIVTYAANIASVGWYRIAEINNGGSNPGDRGNAEFTLRDLISGGGHSTVNFRMGVSYNDRNNMNFTLINHSYYNVPTFTQIRVLTNTTYAVQYLEVYVNRTGNVNFSIFDNIQSSSWKPIAWTVGSVPSGYTTNTYELNKLFNVAGSTEHFTVSRDGNVGIGNSSPTYKLHVNGRLKTNGVNETSDERLKTNIKPLQNASEIINQLQGVSYLWNKEKFPEMNFSENKQYGLLAQQVEKILPDIVDIDNEGYKSVQYTQLIAVLIEALKEQNNSYNNLSADFQKMKAEVEQIKALSPLLNSSLDFSAEKK